MNREYRGRKEFPYCLFRGTQARSVLEGRVRSRESMIALGMPMNPSIPEANGSPC